ncbi:hypothetical protein GGR55DRAFT_683071 [Xylaria sp. FL0064]|nr:hypothetical protein GGR55DRAFT_683071 [Xylaria sp. FL0064]
MSHPPSTPVKVPASATSYTPATQDADLRSQINTLLLRDGHAAKYVCCAFFLFIDFPPIPHALVIVGLPVPNCPGPWDSNPNQLASCLIQERFLHSLDAHSSNWPSTIQSHALALLRSGEVSTFPALIRRVLEDVRRDTAAAMAANTANATSSSANANESNTTKDGVNGAAAVNGASRTGGGVNGASAGADGANLAIPSAVVEAVLKVVKESLEAVCEIEPDGSAGG